MEKKGKLNNKKKFGYFKKVIAWFFLMPLIFVLLLEIVMWILLLPSKNFSNLFKPDPYLIESLENGKKEEVSISYPALLGTKGSRYKYQVEINSQGFRSKHNFRKLPASNTIRIICMGDSYTFGFGLNDEFTYPALLENRLKQNFKNLNFEVINAGVPGYSSHQGLVDLDKKLLSYNPHIIIASYGLNDSQPNWIRSGGPLCNLSDAELVRGIPGFWVPMPDDLTTRALTTLHGSKSVNSFLYVTWLANAVIVPFINPKNNKTKKHETDESPSAKVRVSVKEYADNINTICKLCRQRGIGVVLVEQWALSLQYRNALHKVAAKNRVKIIYQYSLVGQLTKNHEQVLSNPDYKELIDFYYELFGKETLDENPVYYFTFDGAHPNEITNQIFVQMLIDEFFIPIF